MKTETKEQIREEVAAIRNKLDKLLSLIEEEGTQESGDAEEEIKNEDIPTIPIKKAANPKPLAKGGSEDIVKK